MVDAAQEDLETWILDSQGKGASDAPDAAGPQLGRELDAGVGMQDRAESPGSSRGHGRKQYDRNGPGSRTTPGEGPPGGERH